MIKSILEEFNNGDPNTICDERQFSQFSAALHDEIINSPWLSVNRIADYMGMERSMLKNHLNKRGGLRYAEAQEVWQTIALINMGRSSEQPIISKNQLRLVRALVHKYTLARVDRLCVEAGLPKGRIERVYDDVWFREYRNSIDAHCYSSAEILERCAGYTFTQEEWAVFRKHVEGRLQPPRVLGRLGKNRLWQMVKEMGKEWVSKTINVPLATLLSRNYRFYQYTVADFLKIKAEYEKPENQQKLNKTPDKAIVPREKVNNELIPFIEQRMKVNGKEKKAINHVLLVRQLDMTYQQFRSRVYMGGKMTVDEYDKIFAAAKMLYNEAVERERK